MTTTTPSARPQESQPERRWYQRVTDAMIADWSIAFSIVVCLGIVALGVWLTRYELATPPANDPFFYDWQLAEPTFLSRATAWVGFALHNLLIWLTIYYAQKHYKKYTENLRGANWAAVIINVVFIVAHYLQTMFFYDAIAQDLPSWTAQATVIMMLFVILAMENKRRGLFFGKKIQFRQEFYHWMKEYHGYAFSFAVIYTFWFHPMVPTWGHLGGFISVFLVMAQGSLFFTKMHLNKYWKLLVEIMVLPHAALVALEQGGGLVYMFLFGFLAMFIVTQMHGIGLKPWVKTVFYTGFLASALFTYLVLREPFQANEIIRIPVILYVQVFAMYGLWWLFARLTGRIGGAKVKEQPAAAPSAEAA